MARPSSRHPTELELEILKVLWRDGPSTVGQVRDALADFRDQRVIVPHENLFIFLDRTVVNDVRPMPDLDTPYIVDGYVRFGLDVALQSMLYAVIERSPVFGGRVSVVDASRARQVPGVRTVVEVPASAIGELPPNGSCPEAMW